MNQIINLEKCNMKTIFLTLAMTYSLASSAQSKVNFSGKYLINKEKTDFKGAPEYILPRQLVVDQKMEIMIIARISFDSNMNLQKPNVDSLSFFGIPYTKRTPIAQVHSSMKWIDDKSFEITRKSLYFDTNAYGSVVETWSLVNEKSLMIVRNVEQDNGRKYTIIIYFDKSPRKRSERTAARSNN